MAWQRGNIAYSSELLPDWRDAVGRSLRKHNKQTDVGVCGRMETHCLADDAVHYEPVCAPNSLLYLDSTKTREVLTLGARWIRVWWMIRPGFLSAAERSALIVVARDGLVEHRVARRADAIVVLNDGWNCEEVGSALLLDDDTVREWFGVYQRQGMAGLRNFGHEGSSCQLTDEQQ